MHLRTLVVGAVLVITAIAPAGAQAAAGLNGYRVKATSQNLRALAAQGFDLTEGRDSRRGTVDVVGTAEQVGAAKVDARKLSANRATLSAAAVDPTAGPATRPSTSGRSTTRSTSPATTTTRSSTPSSTRAS